MNATHMGCVKLTSDFQIFLKVIVNTAVYRVDIVNLL